MDEAGQHNFSKALAVAKQIFNSLTEYIQVHTCVLHCCWTVPQTYMRFTILGLFSGPVYWESAEFGTQQVVGCSGGIPACFRQHANETITGNNIITTLDTHENALYAHSLFTFLPAGFQSNRATEGTDGFAEGYGGHVVISS